MRIFGSERLDKVLSTLGMQEGEAIKHPWVNKSLERAQAKVEGRNFDIRKQLLKLDVARSWNPARSRKSCRTCAIR